MPRPLRTPTVELHRHFEAGLTPEPIARLAARHGVTETRTRSGMVVAGIDPQDPAAIRRYYQTVAAGFSSPDGFTRFVDSFGLPLSVLQSLEDLEEAVFDQLIACAAAGSLHTELRGSPFTYRERIDGTLEEIAVALVRGAERAWDERGVSGAFILSFSRQKGLAEPDAPDAERQAPVIAALAARLHRRERPVGLDIAGYPEMRYPPRMFEQALTPAIDAGVPITVHAGEQGSFPDFADAPPSLIAEAVERLGAQRIGHGTALAVSAGARAIIRERRVTIECCPVSNDRMGFVRVADHPLPLFLEEGLRASVSTDDPLMFGAFSVADMWEEIADALPLGAEALRQMTRNAIDGAFVSDERRSLLRQQLTPDRGTPACRC